MSIHDAVKTLCDSVGLCPFLVETDDDGFPSEAARICGRVLYVSVEIDELLRNGDERWWDASADLMQFVEGKLQMVRRQGERGTDAHLARLDVLEPGDPDEIWEFRFTTAEPQLRMFGRFVVKDAFVGLTWDDRPDLDFGAAMRGCAEAWGEIFNGRTPLMKGRYPDDYLSNAKLVP